MVSPDNHYGKYRHTNIKQTIDIDEFYILCWFSSASTKTWEERPKKANNYIPHENIGYQENSHQSSVVVLRVISLYSTKANDQFFFDTLIITFRVRKVSKTDAKFFK